MDTQSQSRAVQFVMLTASVLASAGLAPAAGDAKPTVQLRGKLVDEAGAAVANGEVAVYDSRYGNATRSATNGRFTLMVEKEYIRYVMVSAREASGGRLGFFANNNSPAPGVIRLVLRKPRTVTVAVADKQGRPVADARVGAVVSYQRIAAATSDAKGQAVLHVPADAPLQYVYASKPDVGLDYVVYRERFEPANDPYKLAPDHAKPLTLVLDGTRTVRVRVVDEGRKPLAGVRASWWYVVRPKKGGMLNIGRLDDTVQITDKNGVATFRTIPADNTGIVTFWVRPDGYYTPERPMWDPKKKDNDITALLAPLQSVRGKVTFADGRPAAGAQVMVSGAGYQFDDFSGKASAGADGTFTIRVYPDQYYMFVADHARFASAVETRVVLAGKPVEPVRLLLRPATRVVGTVTLGKEQKPHANQWVSLYQKERGDYRLSPNVKQLPNPKDSHKAVVPVLVRSGWTDAQGRFEFFAGPGHYYVIGPTNAEPPQFEITNQKEVGVALHTDRPASGVITGRVVLKSNPDRGVREAKVWGVPTSGSGYLRAVTDAEGHFRGTRGLAQMFVQARTNDGKLSGIIEIGPDDTDVVIPVEPTATVRGRLLDAATGKPLADQQVDFSVTVHLENSLMTPSFGGHGRTNARGEFTLTGLTLGWRFEIQHVAEWEPDRGFARRWEPITNLTPLKAETIELENIKVTPAKRKR